MRYVLSLGLILGTRAMAQPVCSIQIDPDVTICQGQTTILNGPSGYGNYLWSTGANTQNITVGTSGTYWCQVSYPSPQLITNGNFNAGNTGFSTQFNYNSTLTTDGNYWIGTNAALYHPQFSGTGSGNFMIINSGWPSALWNVWCENVTVCPGQTYTLSYRARTLSNATPARLQWYIDGTMLGPEVTLPAFAAGWQTITQTWMTAAGQTNANICLRAMSGDGIGNDIGLDDLSLTGTIVLRDTAVVTVNPLPVFDLGPNATLCTGQGLVLDAAVPGATYLWQDGSTASSYNVNAPGNYGVTVTLNNCSASDNILVNYNPVPAVNLGPDQVLCTGETTTLNATTPGANYVWQDGSTAPTYTVSGPGTYSVTVVVNNCVGNDAVDITYNPTPVVNLGPDQQFCAGGQTVLDATTPGATYIWNDGSTNPTLSATSTSTYDVDVTVNGCTGYDAVNVNVLPLPVVNIGPDQTVCPGTNITLNATTAGATYLWSDGSTGPTLTTNIPGPYSVQVTVNGCNGNDAMTLANYVLPVFSLGPDQTICAGGAANLSVNVAGATYAWNTGATGNSIQPAAAGTYWVDVTTNGCTVRDSVDVIVTPLPVVSLGNDASICPGTNTLLDATTPGATYLWNTGANTPTLLVTPGAYSVQVTANNCSATDAIVIGAFPAAAVTLGPDVTLCPGDDLLLNVAQAGASYLWQDGSIASTYLIQSAGPVSVQLTDANGCVANDAMVANYATPTQIDLGPNASICQGDQLTLDATVPGATYLWNTGAQTPTINVTTTGTYSVVVTQGSCSVNDAMDITTVAPPSVNLGIDQTLCPGDQIILDASAPGATYLWNTGAQTASITVTTGGTFSVVLTNATGCTASDAVDIIAASPGAVNLGPDITLCQGQTVDLDATLPGATYDWSTNSTAAAITVNSSGTYWVEATQGACAVRDTVIVTVNPVPQVDLGNDQTLCAGDNALLDATYAGATYAWSTGASTPSITVNSASTYSVTVDLNGCTASDAVDIGVLSLNAINLGPDVTLCAGETVDLDASMPGVSFLWSTGEQTPSITTGTSGTVWVEATQGACSVSDTVIVTVNPMPQVDLGNDQTLCAGDNAILDATYAGATYAWSTGASTPSITVNTPATYSVTVDLNGCTASDAVDIGVLSLNAINLGSDVTLCAGETVDLDASMPGVTFLWSTGEQTPSITTGTSGTVWVEATQGACSVSDTVIVTVNPMPQVDLGNDQTLCAGDNVILDATYAGATYAWSTGASTPSITVNTPATYSVTVDLNGCTATDAIDIGVLSLNAINLGPDVTLCAGETVDLDASMPGVTFLWSTGEQTPAITTGASGTVWVDATQGACSVSDTVIVTVNPVPQVDLGVDQTLCAGDDAILDATYAGATYAWSTGASTPSITVNSAATYSVTVDLNGCTATDAIDIGVLVPGSFDLGPDQQLCSGDQVVFALGLAGANYLWSTGESSSTITVNSTSTVWVEVSQGVCVASDTVQVNVLDPGSIDLGSDITACEGTLVQLDASVPNASYLWNNGATSAQLDVTSTGNYSVTVTVQQCTITDDVDVTIVPLPVVEIGGDQAICPGASANFDATTPGASYLWQDGSTASTYTSSAQEPVSVTVTVNGCSASDGAAINILPAPIAQLGNDTIICAGASLLLDVTQAGASYNWNNGYAGGSQNITSAGTYGVTVNLNGCTASDAITVGVADLSSVDLGPDQLHCPGEQVVLSTGYVGGTQTWSNGSTGSAITVSQGGTYWAQVQVAACIARDTVQIDYVPLIAPALGPDQALCEGDTTVLVVVPNGASVLWSNGSTADYVVVGNTTNLSVTLSLQGCTSTDAIHVSVLEFVDSLSLGMDSTFCPEDPLVLDVTIPGASYAWNTGAASSSITIDHAGTYSVHATGLCIDASASIEVTEGSCDPLVYVPNSFTPNGDGVNEVFQVSVYGHLRDFTLYIFDRWGERILTTDDPTVTWDGTYNGVAVPDGVYVWKVRYRTRTDAGAVARELMGHVTVLR